MGYLPQLSGRYAEDNNICSVHKTKLLSITARLRPKPPIPRIVKSAIFIFPLLFFLTEELVFRTVFKPLDIGFVHIDKEYTRYRHKYGVNYTSTERFAFHKVVQQKRQKRIKHCSRNRRYRHIL